MGGPSLVDYVLTYFKLVFIVPPTLLWNILSIGLAARQRGLAVSEYAVVAFCRTYFATFTPRQFVVLVPSTGYIFGKWRDSVLASSKKKQDEYPSSKYLTFKETTLDDDGITKIYWMQRRDHRPTPSERKVLLYLHGGGYVVGANPGYIDLCSQLGQHLYTQNVKTDIAILEYKLTLTHQFPAQLRQARNALAHLIQQEDIKPSNIIIGGDSAGGNLTAALLSHLLHPHPDVEALQLDRPLAGAFMISPWLTDDQSTSSYRRNADVDMLTGPLLVGGATSFGNGRVPRDQRRWMWPGTNDASWWTGLEQKVNHVFIYAGEQEIFCDHVVQFAKSLQDHPDLSAAMRSNVDLDVGLGETHIHVVSLLLMKRKAATKNRPLARMYEWLDKVWLR